MSVNKYQPHILVLPEDDANRQLANGFVLDQSVATRNIQVLEEVGELDGGLGTFFFRSCLRHESLSASIHDFVDRF
jgi:hypothetical protein